MPFRTVLILVFPFLLYATSLDAQPSKVISYKVTVKGTSTVHDWESTVEKLECKTTYKTNGHELVDIRDAMLKVTVESIKSTKGRIMDNKTYDAFKSDDFPYIIFTLKSENINTTKSIVELKGTLEMAGVSNPIEMIANYKVLSGGELQIKGDKKVNMTDFRMSPPKAVMGTIKVGEEVTISFDITFSPSNPIL
jgi:hypothetical protein